MPSHDTYFKSNSNFQVDSFSPQQLAQFILENIRDPIGRDTAKFIEAVQMSGNQFLDLPPTSLEVYANLS